MISLSIFLCDELFYGRRVFFRLLLVHVIPLLQNPPIIWQTISDLFLLLSKRTLALIDFYLLFGNKSVVCITVSDESIRWEFSMSQKTVVGVKK